MNKLYVCLIFFVLFWGGQQSFAQQLVGAVNKQLLTDFSVKTNREFQSSRVAALARAKKAGWTIKRYSRNGSLVSLQRVNSLGFPVYLITHNNVTSAATTRTNTVQPGGSLGLNLSGSSTFLNNKLAIWDGGTVYAAHQEFTGKTISLEDAGSVIEHATHVAGTMIAKGIYPPVKGMAFNANTLQSYDFDNDIAEISAAASNLLLSNHSYGDEAGWNYNDGAGHWEWFGLPGDTVDYNFGFYDTRAQSFDKIAYNAPYYLIVESAGNARASTGPAVGEDYYGYKSKTDQTFVDKGPRPANISSNDAYDVISTTGNSKNILTVGAVNPLPFGPTSSKDVSIAYFSSWGPTDDGRVKPDILGMGVNVVSTGTGSTTSYATESGTSMAAPNITGSLYLLQEYYAQKNNGLFMRSATLKGLACHTAFDGGNTGPDYVYGWGLLDMSKAAQAITDNGVKSLIKENALTQGQTQTFKVIASGNGPFIASICWTDPEGTPAKEGTINDRTPKLVNDLDLRVSDGTIHMPWILDPTKPGFSATTGDNIRDNIEQVYIGDAVPGRSYTITVSHKNTLKSGSQNYSLIVTGIGGATYCTSSPSSSADSRINNVKLSNINNTPAAGCTSYSDYTNLTVQLEQGKSYPLSITMGTCGANFSKAAKVYIDWNANGIFESNELVTTTGVVSSTSTYTTNVKVPASVIPGNFSLMRVVLQETTDTATIKPCGTYAKGETQDYRVQFLQTSTDVGVIAIVNPSANGNCSGTSPITVSLKNFGTVDISNIPVTVSITAPDNSVTTFNQTYTGVLTPSEETDFTLSATYPVVGGSTYTVTAKTSLTADFVTSNDQSTATVTVNEAPVPNNLLAYYCDNLKRYLLTGNGDGELLWYQNINDKLPVAAGSSTLTAVAPVNNTYFVGLNDFNGKIGPVDKNVFTGGTYNQFTPAINVTTKIPVMIETARLYIGYPGQITFSVANTNGEIVSTSTLNVTATRSNPKMGVQPDDPADTGRVYTLNLLIPAAGDYTINIDYDNQATIFRNNSGVTGYPFTIGDIFSITGNTATSPTDTAYYKKFWYYLYDIHLKSPGCSSAIRVPVTLTKPVITENGTVLTSNASSGNQWYLNGSAIPGATAKTFTPFVNGNYQVGVSLDNGCVALSDPLNFTSSKAKDDIGLTVYPVPASSKLNLLFNVQTATSLKLSLVSETGATVYNNEGSVNAGVFSDAIDVSHYAAGSYVVKILLGQKIYSRKVIIGR